MQITEATAKCTNAIPFDCCSKSVYRSDRLGTDLNPEGLGVSRILSFKSYETSVCALATRVFVVM